MPWLDNLAADLEVVDVSRAPSAAGRLGLADGPEGRLGRLGDEGGVGRLVRDGAVLLHGRLDPHRARVGLLPVVADAYRVHLVDDATQVGDVVEVAVARGVVGVV